LQPLKKSAKAVASELFNVKSHLIINLIY